MCVTEQQKLVSEATLGEMKEQFFIVYPQLVERFNRGAPTTVNYVIGPTDYAAFVIGNTVTYQAMWFSQNPNDIGTVAHELMHVVQSYVMGPSWITEGIADYARYYYGAKNAAARWALHVPNEGEAYTDGYKTTARFLIWIEQRYHIDFVEALDISMREGSYTPSIWTSMTGKAVSTLWNEYLADPVQGDIAP